MDANTIKIAVLSDLHVYKKTADNTSHGPSYLSVGGDTRPDINPVEGLKLLVDKEKLSVDYLVCAGDLCDKAEPDALNYGWQILNELKITLSAKSLLATAGNHDLDSRHIYKSYDAKEQVQKLRPFHPVADEGLFDKYWSRHYTIYEDEHIRFVILNSAAYHHFVEEAKHGRVSDHTLESLKDELSKLQNEKVNVLLVHHHPHKHQDVDLSDYTSMLGGEKLIDLLNDLDIGRWLIIHGHRHIPNIAYSAMKSSDFSVVFSAGSFSAVLYGEIANVARNQFYIIEIDLNMVNKSSNLFLTGTFKAWDWFTNSGWQKAAKNSGLPANGGFGALLNVSNFSNSILQYIKKNGEPYYNLEELSTVFPELKYLLPKDIVNLVTSLESKGVKCLYDQNGMIHQLGVKQ